MGSWSVWPDLDKLDRVTGLYEVGRLIGRVCLDLEVPVVMYCSRCWRVKEERDIKVCRVPAGVRWRWFHLPKSTSTSNKISFPRSFSFLFSLPLLFPYYLVLSGSLLSSFAGRFIQDFPISSISLVNSSHDSQSPFPTSVCFLGVFGKSQQKQQLLYFSSAAVDLSQRELKSSRSPV